MLDRLIKALIKSAANFIAVHLPHAVWVYTIYEWFSGIIKFLRQINEAGAHSGELLPIVIIFLRPLLAPLALFLYGTGFLIFIILFAAIIVGFTIWDHLFKLLKKLIVE